MANNLTFLSFLLDYIVFLEQKLDLEICFTDNKIKNLVVIFNYKLSSNNMFCKTVLTACLIL